MILLDISISQIYKERSENRVCKMTQKKVYDKEFKVQAVKLGREIGFSKAAKELEFISIPSMDGISGLKMPC